MPAEDSNRDPRVYLAAERTFLAWIRTSLALMGFGFVIARFGLFLRELSAVRGNSLSEPSTLSLPLGIAFVLIGVISIVLAAWRHVRFIEELNRGALNVGSPSRMAIVLALILAAAGLVMAFYLGTTSARQPAPSIIEKEHSSVKTGTELIGENDGAAVPTPREREEMLRPLIA